MQCRVTGCEELVTAPYCAKHLHNNPRSNKRADEAYDHNWSKLSAWLRRRNAQCQKLTRGIRCTNLSQLVHHLVSPRVNPALRLDPENCVCLCRACHPIDEGTPDWRAGVDFVPTLHEISL
jgi:5-methylcytosine-specific restriction endonuclease McrA